MFSFPSQVESVSLRPYLGDFGLCQVMSATNIMGTKTMLSGSPGFQAPEQLRNEGLGLPSYVYAIGAVLVVLFGEKPVWPGLSPYQIMCKVAVCNERPATAHLPQAFQDICNECFEQVSLHPPVNKILWKLIGAG